jgi:glycosyltransferase involved in cell wall biosynthesis
MSDDLALPRFSIFIPIWNEANWLPRAIESVLRQSYPHWRLIIGDNASSDDLASVIRQYPDERIQHHRWAEHTNAYENYNRTMLLCCEPWVQLLCADDQLLPHCLERMADRIEAYGSRPTRLAMVLGAAHRIDEAGQPADDEYYGVEGRAQISDGFHDAAGWMWQMTSPGVTPWNFGAVAVHRDVLAETGGFFRPEIGLCSDVEAALRWSAYGDVAYIDEPLMDYTVRSGSDRSARVVKNRQQRDPLTPMGAALLSGLRAHQERRSVLPLERQRVLSAVARWQLQRATQHRYLPGGRGREDAALDVARAIRYSPRTVLEPRRAMWAAAAVLLPRSILQRGRSILLARRGS